MRFDREEGQVLPQDSWLVYGRNVIRSRQVISSFNEKTGMSEGSAIEKTNIPNGWYVVLRLRFFKKTVDYFDPAIFDRQKRLCFPAILIMCRKPLGRDKFTWFRHITWFPTE